LIRALGGSWDAQAVALAPPGDRQAQVAAR
jgi:hypothetical protein